MCVTTSDHSLTWPCVRSGGGGQRWWDPEWRAQKLASMGAGGGGRDRLQVDHAEWREKLDRFRRCGEKEMQVRENYGRDGVEEIHQLAAEQGLYSKAYGKGRNTVLVVSRDPLPNYRADLDAKLEGKVQHVGMSSASKAMMQDVLARIPDLPGHDVGDGQQGQLQQQPPPHDSVAAGAVPDAWDEEDVDDGAALYHKTPASGVPQGGRAAIHTGRGDGALSAAEMEEKSARLRSEWEARTRSPAYASMMEKRKKLPSFGMRDKLLAHIRAHRVVVVSGETGCGKTTQVPQFVLDDMDACGQGAACSIICTQPRRISAISVAERVACERCEPLGQSVGYILNPKP
jgi:ATP-dependent RNA helicase DHX36